MYCSNCGKLTLEEENFCSRCGNSISSSEDLQVTSSFRHVFSSSIFVGGHILTPDRIILDEVGITYKRRNKYLIGVDKSFLAYSSISYVKIDRGVIRSAIIIASKGNESIRAKHFFIRDAKKIKKIIQENIK
jgi:hypothetical protein